VDIFYSKSYYRIQLESCGSHETQFMSAKPLCDSMQKAYSCTVHSFWTRLLKTTGCIVLRLLCLMHLLTLSNLASLAAHRFKLLRNSRVLCSFENDVVCFQNKPTKENGNSPNRGIGTIFFLPRCSHTLELAPAFGAYGWVSSVSWSGTVGRTPWTGDQFVARPLPVQKHRKTSHIHKH
jgi:hypothetical protein